LALGSHSLDSSICSSHCFFRRFSSAIDVATCFFASTSWFCISSTIWFSIFCGSSALLMRSLRFDLMSVPILEKIPMVMSLADLRCGVGRRGCEAREVGVMFGDGHRHVIDDRLDFIEVQVLELEGVDQTTVSPSMPKAPWTMS